MKTEIRSFLGMRPQMVPDDLRPGEATIATNCKLTSGGIEPFRNYSDIVTLSGATPVVSLYRYGQLLASETQYWFQFTVDTDVAKGPVVSDTEERTYWTDGTYPKKTKADIATGSAPYPTASLRMGLPAPAAAPTVTVTGSATVPTDPGEAVTFCYTYVSAWGEEGPPSPASTVVTWRAGQTLAISGMSTAPAGAYNIASKRLYRSATGTTDTEFQFCRAAGDIPVATTTYNDTELTAALGDVLASTTWLAPPDNMIGLTNMQGGIMAGFFGNTLCFSEPYLPYAWPPGYQLAMDAPIVGIGAFDQSLFVGTTQGVYVVTGVDPANMTPTKLSLQQSCVSKRSVVSMSGGVVWASPDGLWMVDASGARKLTDGVMTRVEWQAYNPSSIAGYASDGRYIGMYDTGTVQGGLIFAFSPATFTTTDVYATAGYRDKRTSELYLVIGNHVKKWDASGALTATWQSSTFLYPSDLNMACARVNAAAYPLTFNLYANGTLKWTQTVTSHLAFRLPSGYLAQRYSFSVVTTGVVRDVAIATSMNELTSG